MLNEKDKEEKKRNAEREMKKAALEHELKVRELALKEWELKIAKAQGGN